MAIETNDEALARLLHMTEAEKQVIVAAKGWHQESAIYSHVPTALEQALQDQRRQDDALTRHLDGLMRAILYDAEGIEAGASDACPHCQGRGIVALPGLHFALRICDACDGTGSGRPPEAEEA